MLSLYSKFEAVFARIPEAATLLFARIAVGHVFWASGRSKVEGLFTLRPEVIDLFRDEYGLPFIAPEVAAPLTMVAEHALPLLLVAGLFTRFAALGLMIMTLVIQFLVYPDAWWPQHSLWVGPLLIILSRGAGAWSLDAILLKQRV